MFPPPFRAPHPPLPKGSYDQYGGYTGGYAKEPAGGYGRSQYGFGEKNILGPYGKRFMGIYSENYHGPRHMEKPYFPPAIPPQNYYHNQDLNDEIHCFTCDIWCHGPAQYTAHTQGSKHQKQVKEEKNRRAVSKMKFIKYDEASNTYECTYCRTALNSCSVVVMHVAGVRHQDKAYEIEGPRPSSDLPLQRVQHLGKLGNPNGPTFGLAAALGQGPVEAEPAARRQIQGTLGGGQRGRGPPHAQPRSPFDRPEIDGLRNLQHNG
ncbi:unnamed protein product [Nesidiocoris tenuis]|uniref:C2H2-type domain-containing protein n=1 Tax=Nesidiocoris tenuis TaxID=355587 RepID=A0A6H5HCN3_9HEMI|nr:unnamed protein product [Nesidiocoris tenuis]